VPSHCGSETLGSEPQGGNSISVAQVSRGRFERAQRLRVPGRECEHDVGHKRQKCATGDTEAQSSNCGTGNGRSGFAKK
jgi:hypothetical protein